MRKWKLKICLITIIFLFLVTASVVYAQTQKVVGIKSGEVVAKSWYASGDVAINEGSIGGDMIVAGSTISSSGIVGKDLIAIAAQTLTNTGVVSGDIICLAKDINVSGKVLGNMRAAAGQITMNGNIDKNINVISNIISIGNTADLGGNLMSLSEKIEIDGKVRGDALIQAKNIKLNGEFFGDVNINPANAMTDETEQSSTVTISPTTIIHGKLTYTGIRQVQIPQGAKISDFEWVKPKVAEKTNDRAGIYIYKFIKLIFTTIIYYLIAMLLYKLFPEVFKKHGEIISEKPARVFSTGLISLASILLAIFIFVVLLVLSLIISPSIAFVFASVVTLFYILLFFFSTVPVSLWLGNKLFKDKYNLPYRFGGGLALLTFGLFALKLLSELRSSGALFGMLWFIIAFTSLTYGIGALLCVKKEIRLADDKVTEK